MVTIYGHKILILSYLSRDCVKLLLFTDKNEFPKDLLHTDCTPYHHYDSSVSTTPFRDLIKYMPGIHRS